MRKILLALSAVGMIFSQALTFPKSRKETVMIWTDRKFKRLFGAGTSWPKARHVPCRTSQGGKLRGGHRIESKAGEKMAPYRKSRMRYRSLAGIALASLVVFGVCGRPAFASNATLGFGSLPSAQGFSFVDQCAASESSLYSVSNNALHQDTLSCANLASAFYQLSNVVTASPFRITVTARVTSEQLLREGDFGHFGAGFGAESNGTEYFIGFGGGFIDGAVLSGPGLDNTAVLSTSIDTTQFHTYVLNATPANGGFTLSVDGTQIFSGVGHTASLAANDLFLGDGSSRAHAIGDYTQYRYEEFGRVVPEPGSFLLLGTGLAGLTSFGVIRRRRKAA